MHFICHIFQIQHVDTLPVYVYVYGYVHFWGYMGLGLSGERLIQCCLSRNYSGRGKEGRETGREEGRKEGRKRIVFWGFPKRPSVLSGERPFYTQDRSGRSCECDAVVSL